MKNRFDILTEINLKEIIDNKNQLYYYHLLDENGEYLHDDLESTISSDLLVDYMIENNLIKKQGEYCVLIKNGIDIYNNGGWFNFINSKKETQIRESLKENNRQDLKDKIDQLNYESLKHKEKIREQENRIRNLTEQLTFINLIKAYKWYISFIITIAIALGYFLSLLTIG